MRKVQACQVKTRKSRTALNANIPVQGKIRKHFKQMVRHRQLQAEVHRRKVLVF